MFNYYQLKGGEEQWAPVPATHTPQLIADSHPMFVTVLTVNKLVEDLTADQRDKLAYEGPYYIDWDGADIATVIPQVHALMNTLESMKLDLNMARWYATGGKGFHVEIPSECFMEKQVKGGVPNLPVIYKEMTFQMYVDTMDMRVYSQGRGRMWRQPNVVRESGRCKVQLTAAELRGLTKEAYEQLTSAPRPLIATTPPQLCIELAVCYSRAAQKVEEKLKARGKRKRDPNAKERAACTSIKMMMAGIGIKQGTGFHELALQISIAAATAGMTEEQMLADSAMLCENHVSDGHRYNTPAKRRAELSRMYRYVNDNPMYEFSIGAVKSLLTHTAPDLDGIAASAEDIKEGITEAEAEIASDDEGEDGTTPDEYKDLVGGITLSRFGVYAPSEDGGKKRICGVSFRDAHILMSCQTGQMAAYEAEVLVNGKSSGRVTIEMDTFQSLQMFNRFCQRFGHQMQGSEAHLRGVFMRFIELAKKKGRQLYIAKREGLDIFNIPNHEDAALREPFMVWADGRGVQLEPRVSKVKGLDISFQGFPDPRGLFKCDIADAPKLSDWIEVPANKDLLRETLRNMLTCQKPDVISKLVGWYTACFYRMPFHRAYNKFPILHTNGAAGAGKTEMNKVMAHLFYLNQEPVMLTPGSTVFAVSQHMSASASIPVILDEYKPHEMTVDVHNKFKLMIRDAYNCRDILKGGGNRESDDYRSLAHTQLAAPLCFIAEAAEEEAAVAERVVLVTVVKPSSTMALKYLARFQLWNRNKHVMAILGQYLAAEAVSTTSITGLRDEFDALFETARNRFMFTEADVGRELDAKELALKQGAKERSVFNFTVALFGLLRFKRVVEDVFGAEEFFAEFTDLEGAIYTRMSDLQPATQAEWAKVMDQMANMTYSVEQESPVAMRPFKDYAFGEHDGKQVVEIAMNSAYLKYRAYMKQTGSRPLYSGVQSFLHSIKDSPALVDHGMGHQLQQPGVYRFYTEELARMQVGQFKD